MALQITVRGSAEERHDPERATVRMVVVVEGADKEAVVARAAAAHEPLVDQLRSLEEGGAVSSWSSDQVRVHSRRPWQGDEQSSTLVHTARLHATAELVDLERLGAHLEDWAGRDGVEVVGIDWDVTDESRRLHEAEVRKAAVADAVAKAQAYADAVRRGPVVAVELSDPGMLEGDQGAPPVAPVALARSTAHDGGDALVLEPQEIVIGVEVDARFRAE